MLQFTGSFTFTPLHTKKTLSTYNEHVALPLQDKIIDYGKVIRVIKVIKVNIYKEPT
jgi:hypothetical protein